MQTVIRQLEALQERGIEVPPFPTVRIPASLENPVSEIPLDEKLADIELQARIDEWRLQVLALHRAHFGPR